MRKLTPKQIAFCQEYVVDLNAKQAAIRSGYSPKTADKIGWQLLEHNGVKQYIAQLSQRKAQRVQVTADMVLEELIKIAKADITQAFDENGGLKPLHEIPEDVRRCISHLEVHELFDGQGDQKHAFGLAKKVKFYDKTKALELLGKHLALFTEKIKLEEAAKELTDEELFQRAKAVLPVIVQNKIEDKGEDT